MWKRVFASFKALIPALLKKYFIKAVLGAVGITGGFYVWIVDIIVNKLWVKLCYFLDHVAHLLDQEHIDNKVRKEYEEAIKSGAPEKKLIDIETDILNGGRK